MKRRCHSIMRFAALVVLPAAGVLAPEAAAQAVQSSLLTRYLNQTGLSWKVSDKDPNVFTITKTAELKKASRVEVVITNIPDKQLVTLRAYPLVGGEYLHLASVLDKEGLMKEMLQNSATSFGGYMIDSDGDIGFRYVFTTESGLGYESFKVACTELLRIADDPVVTVYSKYK